MWYRDSEPAALPSWSQSINCLGGGGGGVHVGDSYKYTVGDVSEYDSLLGTALVAGAILHLPEGPLGSINPCSYGTLLTYGHV